MKIIIIEDEPLMAQALREELESLDRDLVVTACLDSIATAEHYLAEHDLPDLFFSDIQLPDGLSFEIFRRLNSTVPVIFCTAYDEYALEAFRRNGIDYLLKPFDREMLVAALDKLEQLRQAALPLTFDPEQLLKYFELHSPKKSNTILVQRGDRIIPVRKNHLAILQKKDGITYAFTFQKKKYVLDQNLDTLEQTLGNDFFRANRQYILHREAVREVERYFARKLVVKLNVEHSEKIIISKARSTSFLLWLQQH